MYFACILPVLVNKQPLESCYLLKLSIKTKTKMGTYAGDKKNEVREI